jgi:hypothetical protein
MVDIYEADDFDPKRIADAMIKKMLQAKAWDISCYVDEVFVFTGKPIPFDMKMRDGVYTCRVIAPSRKEAMKIVADFMPVIKFVNDDE